MTSETAACTKPVAIPAAYLSVQHMNPPPPCGATKSGQHAGHPTTGTPEPGRYEMAVALYTEGRTYPDRQRLGLTRQHVQAILTAGASTCSGTWHQDMKWRREGPQTGPTDAVYVQKMNGAYLISLTSPN